MLISTAEKPYAAMVGLVFLALAAGLVYLLPSLLAMSKKNGLSIFALNVLLGWTFVGWVVALVWALSVDEQATVVVNTPVSYAAVAQALLCSKCGRYNDPQSKFCGFCGENLLAIDRPGP
jgi:hypothetical protein